MKTKILTLTTLLFVITIITTNAQDFNENIVSTNADIAYSVFAIDIDSDGDMDILSASHEDDKIAWYENDGSETFTEHIISTNADGAFSVFAIDVDSDGDIDVLSGNDLANSVVWYENDGNETFTEHIITTNADGISSVFAIDIDGDNDIDILSADWGYNIGDDNIVWYENDGSETFTEHSISTNANWGMSVFAIDVDSDGDIDILSASADDNKIAWYENNGSQTFTEHIISTNADNAQSVFAIDIDGDSDIDVLSASSIDNKIAWYENNGSQTFTEHSISTNADGACSVFAIDIDGDNDIDILSASAYDDKIAWYEHCTNTYNTITETVCDSYLSPTGNTYTTSGTYNETIPNAIGCDSIITINLTVNHSISIPTQPTDENICLGNSITFSIDSVGTSPSFQWIKDGFIISGATNSTYTIPTVELTNEGVYSCQISNMCNTLTSNTSELKVIELTINAGLNELSCLNEDIQLNAITTTNHPTESQPYTSITWSPTAGLSNANITNPIAQPTSTTTYTVLLTDAIGCTATSSVEVFVQNAYHNQEICMVTVDTLTGQNLVVWEPTENVGIEEYIVHREGIIAGSYNALGTVPAGNLTVYVDATANPMSEPYKYKITTKDTCGNYSSIDSCDYHKTIHLQTSLGSPEGYELNWTEYEGFPYSTYNIYGRETGVGNFVLVHQSAYGNVSWTDGTSVPNMEYRIAVEKAVPCLNTKTCGGPYNQSISNIDDYSTSISDANHLQTSIYLYPNPCTGIFTVRGENITKITITDINGKTILTQENIVKFNNIDLTKETKGIYFVKIIGEGFVSTQKLVLE